MFARLSLDQLYVGRLAVIEAAQGCSTSRIGGENSVELGYELSYIETTSFRGNGRG